MGFTVNGNSVKRGSVNMSYSMPVRQATWEQVNLDGMEIGQTATVAIDGTQMLTGAIKSITRYRPANHYEIMAEDVLCQAVEFWFAPDNLDTGYTWSNINHLDLTKAMLNAASIPNSRIVDDWTASGSPTFQFATGPEPFKVTIASAWDVISQICQITGMFVYADSNGYVHMTRIWDEASTVASRTFCTASAHLPYPTIKTIQWYRSDENLRNRVVVYGYQGAYGRAQATSPYVPADFYRTAIISYESIVDSTMAQETANINLQRLNKLTESIVVEVLGDTSIEFLSTVEILDPNISLSGNWFMYQVEHKYDTSSGYVVRMTCVK